MPRDFPEISEGCRLKRDIPMDQSVKYDDMVLPQNRTSDRLRMEQERHFSAMSADR